MSFKIIIKTVWNKLLYYINFLLFAFYFTIGFLFLYTKCWVDFIPQYREVIGAILIFFGAMRFYVSLRRYQKKHRAIKILKAKRLRREQAKERRKKQKEKYAAVQ